MSEKVAFLLDGQEMLTYDRGQDLPEQHKSYLDKMDEHMDEGINLSGDRIVNPDLQQKTQFVVVRPQMWNFHKGLSLKKQLTVMPLMENL